MKLTDYLVDPAKLATYSPPKHAKTINHRLWPIEGRNAPFEIIHGFLGFEGGAEPHYHLVSDQMVYLLSGSLRIVGNEDEVTMEPGHFIYLPKGLEHRVDILSPEGVNILIMYMPRLSMDDILPAKHLLAAGAGE
ncbi:MAG: cupin domain-containing protein [Pseudomonadota bacterium]